jgi:predicted dehydrogenase
MRRMRAMRECDRRDFLKGALSAAALAAVSHGAWAQGDDEVRHAVIGIGNQGRNHCGLFSAVGGCRVVAVADVDPERREAGLDIVSEHGPAEAYEDFRAILDDDSVHSVSVATCDHWHTPVALAALAAGKHVYVEKPCSHNLHEGHVLAQAAADTGLCVQHGTQSRSGEGIQEAMVFLAEGGLGTLRAAKAIDHQLRAPIGRAEPEDPPPGVDYDLWLGPAPKVPFTRNRWHYNWHWFWDYGTGDIGNDGIHQLDVARWGLGAGLPLRTTATGGQLFYDDDHETPDTQVVTYDYGDRYLIYEMRLWTPYPLEGHHNGVAFYGDDGRLDVGGDGCVVTYAGGDTERLGGGADTQANVRNFVECARAGDPAGLNAPISEGVVSAALAHLGNIGTRVGRPLEYDAVTQSFPGDEEATALASRGYRDGYELPQV